MASKSSKEIEDQIVGLLKAKKSYSEIAKITGVSKPTISRVKNRNTNLITIPKNDQVSVSRRRKLSEAAIRVGLVKRGDAVAGNLLNLAYNMQYIAEKMVGIVDKSEGKIQEIMDGLSRVEEIAREQIEAQDKDEIYDQEKVITAIRKALSYVGNFHAAQDIIIKAAKEFRESQTTFVKLELEAKALKDIKDLLDAIFESLNVLDDKDYERVRARAIELYPAIRNIFSAHEKVENAAGNSDEQK